MDDERNKKHNMRLQRLIDAYNIRMELQQEVIKKDEVAKKLNLCYIIGSER